MRRILIVFLGAFVVSQGTALAGFQDFTLGNRTGTVIDELYISASDVDDWAENQCQWDFLVSDEDGDEIIWEAIDLSAPAR
ncbi:MAG: hypothetical protein FDZ69_09335 [Deltaproteobacteria bacterium]|nr:MAG: hypothetical protein FDZ69_09335 [Deltaproteobacteria bacterium]